MPFALIGGLAATVRGRVRATEDINLVVGCGVDRALGLLKASDAAGFAPAVDEVRELIEIAFVLPLEHIGTGVRIDLALGLTLFEQEAIGRATETAIAGGSIPVVTAEDLLIMKLLADRPQDQQDIVGLIEEASDHFDWPHCHGLAEEFAAEVEVDLRPRLRQLEERFRNRPPA